MNNLPPSISFELGVGEFRIVTPEAVYLIKVCPELVEATRNEPGRTPETAGGPAFFQELSKELFDKVGRLARQLSVSVEELPAEMPPDALGDTDQQLENAKGQLEEVIDLTEKASMSIMDSADEIQNCLTLIKNELDTLKDLNFTAEAEDAPAPDADSPAEEAGSPFLEKLVEAGALLDFLLAAELDEAPLPAEPETVPEEAAPELMTEIQAEKLSVLHFDVDVVFQTLYELCTNESVKDHIRSMREAQAADFDGPDISAKLTEMSAAVPLEEGFYSFPISAVLKTIYGATESEEFRAILKKMNQTAASIFLDSVLPLEGEMMEIEAPAQPDGPDPEDSAPPEPMPEELLPDELVPDELVSQELVPTGRTLRTLRALNAELEAMARSGPGPGRSAPPGPAKDCEAIVQALSHADGLIQKTGRHLTRILESLAFQDLSGQRIKKVVALMGDIQAQLLSILVSVDTKLKVHEAGKDPAADPQKTEKMAQDEVDKALEKLMGPAPSELLGPGAEHRLNQNAVNDLLAQLGF